MSTTKLATTAFVQTELVGTNVAAGAVIFAARTTAPAGYLKANGAAVSRTVYAALFAAIGTTFGAGDGSTTFNLPDLRGQFMRGGGEPVGIFLRWRWYAAQSPSGFRLPVHRFVDAARADERGRAVEQVRARPYADI